MKSKINDRICAIIFLVFGIALYISVPIFTSGAKYDPIGSRFFPYAIAVCFVIVAGLLLIGTFTSKKTEEGKGEEKTPYKINVRDNVRTVLFCVLLLGSVYLIEKVHFLGGIFVMLTSMLLLCKVKKPIRYLIVYGCALLAYFVFTRYFNVRL